VCGVWLIARKVGEKRGGSWGVGSGRRGDVNKRRTKVEVGKGGEEKRGRLVREVCGGMVL